MIAILIMVLLDLFSGIGGFAFGLKQAGYTFEKHYFSEVDKYAIANYKYNFKESEYVGKVEEVAKERVGKVDIITFGFPCQDFSFAGKQKGLKGKRGGLFFEAIRIIKDIKPNVFIFENVKGLLSSNEGQDFELILKEIANIGLYECEWQLINSSWFLPQNRERIYFIGHLRGTLKVGVFPLPITIESFNKISAIHLYTKSKSQNQRVYKTTGLCPTIQNSRTENKLKIFTGNTIRRLTPKECERLQGLPDDWTKWGITEREMKEIPATQRYKMIGNAVSVPVVKAIGERLLEGGNMGSYEQEPEIVLYGTEESFEEYNVPEVKLRFNKSKKIFKGKISKSQDVADFIKKLFPINTLEIQEQLIVLYLNKANKVKGFYRHTVGSITSVTIDPRIIIAGAIKSLSTGIIIAHNHPSGNASASEADNAMTRKFAEICRLMDIAFLDHLIITRDGYFSYADNTAMLAGIESLSSSKARARIKLIEKVLHNLPINNKNEKDITRVLLRNGVIQKDTFLKAGITSEEEAIKEIIEKERISNEPLTFSELTRYNTWFFLHPEKVAGEEIITTSREFPITIKGDKQAIIDTIRNGISENTEEMKQSRAMMMKAKAEAIRIKLLLMKDDELGAIEELGELGELVRNEIATSELAVRNILSKEEKQRKYSSTDTLSFEEVIRLYNSGISEDEIKAWVWYKRSLGFPMKGWEKYYLPNIGEAQDQLFSTRETMIKDNHFRDLNKVNSGVLLGKPSKFKNEYGGTTYLIFTGTDGNKYYVSEKDTEIKKATFKTDPKILDDLVKVGALFLLNGDLLPLPIYVYGNMYDRELALEKDKEAIISKYGEQIYERHKEAISKAKPRLISVTNPDPKERPKILSISDFARNFHIKDLKLETGIELSSLSNEAVNLPFAFELWLKSLDKESFKEVSSFEIIHYYLHGHNLSKNLSDEEKEQIERYAPIEGEELFSRFLYEALTFEDQQKIDFSWNRVYNGQSSVQHHKIPVGFICSAMFKKSVLEFTPAQREAIAFMEAIGSGVIAYDVGVGKTMSAIITLANAMYQGKCSNPLIVVPNPTYKKWVREIIGYTDEQTKEFIPGVLSNTKIKINEWYNLGSEIQKKINLNKKLEPNTITVVTYEGFVKLGFSEKVMGQMFEQLAGILSQGRDDLKSARDKEKKFQKYREMIGTGIKDTIADIDTLGIDYIVIDEAHNFKNIFSDVKADEDGVKRYKIQGSESARGIKAFFLCNYIQRTYRQNIMLLTATPFTNSPLEIYSMLSLVGYESMKNMGIINLERFMETFVQQSLEYAPNYKDEIVATPVVKSFNNRLVLQKLIYNHINYKTGEEAGVKRPCKVNLPRIYATAADGSIKRLPPESQILTYLSMTPAQRMNQEEIVQLARSAGPFDGKVMKALGQSLDNALSPFLYKNNLSPEDYIEFVEESPKIKYALECVKSVKQYHEERNEPVSGQIIYANRGKDFFPMIKEYLEKEIGYKKKVTFNKSTLDEVEIISSGISQERKELIKDAFLEGVVKIIIGTATIREGIDLQKKCTNIYNLYPDWNPTDIKQLEGRGWRQGNEFGYVRVTMPLVENSMDVFVFQKLDEKMHRINDIWYRGDRGNVLDIESLDPEEVKFALFTNMDALAQLQLGKEAKDITRRIALIESQIDTLKRFDFKVRKFFEYQAKSKDRLSDLIQKYKTFFFSESQRFKEENWWKLKTEKQQEEFLSKVKGAIEEAEAFLSSTPQEDKELLRLGRQMYSSIKETGMRDTREDVFGEFKAYLSEVRKAEKTILEQRGYTIHDNLQKVIEEFEKEHYNILQEKEKVSSREHYEVIIEEIKKKKEKLSIQGKTIEERAEDFAKLNYLLEYKASEVDGSNCILPDPKTRQRPPKELPEESERSRKLRMAKLKSKAIKIKLELLNLN